MAVKVRKPSGYQSWCVVIDHEGQRRTVAVGTRQAAERVRREIETRLALGQTAFPTSEKPLSPTLAEYADMWLTIVDHECKPSTSGFYRQYLRLYVLPRFGAMRLHEITRTEAKQFLSDMATKGLAKNTIRLAVTALRALLSAATEDRILEHNAAHGLGRFVKSEKRPHEAKSLRPVEVQQLLTTAKAILSFQDYALLFTALRTGLRAGEIAGLLWGDIRFGASNEDPERFILVERNYDRRWSRSMLTPKSKKSRRVDMSRELRGVLQQLRGMVGDGISADLSKVLVFPSDAGTPIEMNNFSQRVFKPLLVAAGLADIRFHDLRHTFGSLLIQTGASLAYVRDQMGHSSIQVTVDIYGHLIPGANVSFVDRLDASSSPQESARQPQDTQEWRKNDFPQVLSNDWLGRTDSNRDTQIQSLQSYR